MPKRSDINKVLVLGAGPIVIGQACEFDYSGTQACRALKEENIYIVLLNSNPATIMTDPDIADATYIEPINKTTAQAIIEKEKIDAVLPTMGGQTALNCAMDLYNDGVFNRDMNPNAPRLIGASADSIRMAEDRQLFKRAMTEIGLSSAPSAIVSDLSQIDQTAKELGFPIILRPSYTLGGSGGGIAYNLDELRRIATRGLSESPAHTILLERSLLGWKEFEMEVVRDSADNCIIICSIENLDPMGVHTGDSITIAPAQTLTDKEYQRMRDASIAVLRKIGVDTGGANVQFAINPANGDMVIIEMNPRVSRSSALASKATGFPIAKVATRLAIGYTLDEIKNDITVTTPASFEPSIDYIVTKAPRFDFSKFAPAEDVLTTQMQSVGEVMAIGGTFAESLQKALRGLETNVNGLHPIENNPDTLEARLSTPSSTRLFAVAEAFSNQTPMSIDVVHQLTGIDPWFLNEIYEIARLSEDIKQYADNIQNINAQTLMQWKQAGFSDKLLAQLLTTPDAPIDEITTRRLRHQLNIHPVYRRIDTCAGEFPTDTAYLYSTYFYAPSDPQCELRPTNNSKIVILGGGPNRIGQGIEFDYCCIHAVMALKNANYETIMINCNPETVSTDYDIADRLFFESLTAEDVIEICRQEKPDGVIVQFGGQTPLTIAHALQNADIPIIGTPVDAIDRAESRQRFQALINHCDLRQPQSAIVDFKSFNGDLSSSDLARKTEEAVNIAARIQYPIIARPSYVLGGKSMQIAHDENALRDYFARPWLLTFNGEILLDKFLNNGIEVDIDAIRDAQGNCVIVGVMEHIEQAGVHSGDSACCLPPHTLSPAIIEAIKKQSRALANELGVIGLINIQFAVCQNDIYILEANPRASRTAPFVSKATNIPIAKIAALAMAGHSLIKQGIADAAPPPYFSVKEAVFPFSKFPNIDVLLGPEMKSTGESMGIAKNFPQAFILSQQAIQPVPQTGTVFISVPDIDKAAALQLAQQFEKLGFNILATSGSARYFAKNNISVTPINKVKEGRPHIVDAIVNGDVHIVINTETAILQSRLDSLSIRRAALAHKVLYFTTVAGANALAQGLQYDNITTPHCLQQWHKQL